MLDKSYFRSTPLRIAFVIPYFYPAWEYGGQPRSAYELARALVRRGHQIKVLTTDSGGAKRLVFRGAGRKHRRELDGMEVIYYPNVSNFLAYRYRLFWPPQMFKDIQSELRGTDIVHIHELRNTVSVCAYRAVRRLSLPYVLSTHGGLKHLGRKALKVLYDGTYGNPILRNASALIAVSPIEESEAIEANVPRGRIQRLPNVIAASGYAALPEPGAFRRRWAITSEKIILFLRRLHWLKGADLLIQAFHQVRKMQQVSPSPYRERVAASLEGGPGEGFHLVLAGPDDGQEPLLRRSVASLGLEAHVTFTGFLDHDSKLEALVDASLVVVPSRSDVFAITVGEALICGRPVLVSSACGFYPLPRAEGCVQFFRTEDVDDLAQKLLAMLYEDRLQQCAEECRSFVAHEFSPDNIASQAERIYEEALQSEIRNP